MHANGFRRIALAQGLLRAPADRDLPPAQPANAAPMHAADAAAVAEKELLPA